MATFISDALTRIDTAITGYAEGVFTAFAGPVTGALQAMGLVGLAFVAVNSIMSLYPIRFSEYLKWGVRYIVVLAVATSWAQFLPIYNIITNVPSSVAAALLDQTGAPNLNVAMDEMVTNIFNLSDNVGERAGTFDFAMSLTSVVLTVLGAFMATVAIIVSSVAKIGLAMAVSLAPIFIGSLLFRATSDLFTTWSRFTLGFALIPLALAGIMGAVIGVGRTLIVDPDGLDTLGDAAGFLIIVLAGIILMSQIPTIVNSLAGGIVATASGLREMQTAGDTMRGGARRAQPRLAAAASMVGAAAAAEGGVRDRVNAALEDGRATSAAMKENREKYVNRAARLGRQTSFGERAEAARAGLAQAARDQAATRRDARVKLADDPPPEPRPVAPSSTGTARRA